MHRVALNLQSDPPRFPPTAAFSYADGRTSCPELCYLYICGEQPHPRPAAPVEPCALMTRRHGNWGGSNQRFLESRQTPLFPLSKFLLVKLSHVGNLRNEPNRFQSIFHVQTLPSLSHRFSPIWPFADIPESVKCKSKIISSNNIEEG